MSVVSELLRAIRQVKAAPVWQEYFVARVSALCVCVGGGGTDWSMGVRVRVCVLGEVWNRKVGHAARSSYAGCCIRTSAPATPALSNTPPPLANTLHHPLAQVSAARRDELRGLAVRKYLDALCVYFWWVRVRVSGATGAARGLGWGGSGNDGRRWC